MTRPLLIGQSLNAVGSRRVADALRRRDPVPIRQSARRQAQNGADVLDVCAISADDEPAALQWLAETVQAAVSLPLSLDTLNPDALRRALPFCRVPPFVNGYSGVLPRPDETRALLRRHPHLTVIALCLDERGPHSSPDERLELAARFASELRPYGISPTQIIFDPITLPATFGPEARAATLETMSALRERFPDSRVLCAVGNYGYGSEARHELERAWLEEASAAGADVFLCNPLLYAPV